MTWVDLKPASVVTLESALDLVITETATSLIRGYLTLLKNCKNSIPQKQQMDIGQFSYALPNVVLFAVSVPGECRVRVIGEKLKATSGLNTTGRNYYDFVAPERRKFAQAAIEMMIGHPCGTRSIIELGYDDGQTSLTESIALPLLSEEEGVDGFAICCDQLIEKGGLLEKEFGIRTNSTVLRRDLIDLGFGVPKNFQDIVPAAKLKEYYGEK